MESKEQNSMKEEEQTNATTSENVQDNIENQDSTKTEETNQIEEINFSELSKEDIVSELLKLVNNNHINDIKQLFEEGLKAYYSLYEKDFNNAKTTFVESGEKEENFSFRDPSKENMDLIEKTFKTKKHEYYKSQEDKKEFNLKAKHDIIEEIKNLVNNQESMNDTFNQFKELQRKWHEIRRKHEKGRDFNCAESAAAYGNCLD